jgi:hypothetical protein
MSGEIEAAGAAITAGLAAGAIEGREGHGAGEGACLNCGAPLSGAFCSQCGQSAHPHRTLAHMFEEVIHGILHFDTKAWRTLPMVAFRPGTLTRNYIYGKRARYISPLALFLFTIFLMFFVFAFTDAQVLGINDATPAEAGAELEEARAELEDAEQELAQAREAPPDQYTGDLDVRLAQQAVDLARAEVERRQRALEQSGTPEPTAVSVNIEEGADAGAPAGDGASGPFIGISGNETVSDDLSDGEGTWQEALRDGARNGNLTVNTGFPALDERILHSFENPDLALYKVQQAAYKFSFLLVPISLPFIWLLFVWRRGLTLYDHVVFTLYSLSFASMVFVVVALLSRWTWTEWVAGPLVTFGMPVHMFFHLKGAYALGWFSALWRSFFLFNFAILSLSVFALAIIVLGLAG